jgi:hypothetical protein
MAVISAPRRVMVMAVARMIGVTRKVPVPRVFDVLLVPWLYGK